MDKQALFNEKAESERENRAFLITCVFLLIWFAAFFLLNNFNFMYVEVDGASMNKTLNDKDVLCVNKRLKAGYGDIVIIDKVKHNASGGYDYLIKRVIAVGGDTVKIENEKVYRNGVLLDEKEYAYFGAGTPLDYPETKIPEGYVFYLGDNRRNSSDSRTYGCCPEEYIVGVVPDTSLKLKKLSKFRADVTKFIQNVFRGNR